MTNAFSERLALCLQQKKITQKELATKAGVTEAAMSHYLKGDRNPRAFVLVRIAEALGTTTDYLIGGNNNDCVGELNYAKRLIVRNVRQMTKEEKMDFINILLSDD